MANPLYRAPSRFFRELQFNDGPIQSQLATGHKAEAAKQEAQAIRTDTSRFLNKNPLKSARTRR